MPSDLMSGIGSSAHNRFVGLVTNLLANTVMTHIELQRGPHHVILLVSSDAAQQLAWNPAA
ncbi:MAG TPA: hypothetical protein VFN75_03265 [Pseudonocardiaceae bacterium]|nr:hypothetical protein [Pseudonocardiaceae bacterium]